MLYALVQRPLLLLTHTPHSESSKSATWSMKLGDFEAWVTVDGIALEEYGATIIPSKDQIRGALEVLVQCSQGDEYRADGDTTRDFLFSKAQLTDEDAYLAQPVSKQLGEIRLKIRQGHTDKQPNEGGTDEGATCVFIENEKIHESSKKITNHCIGLSYVGKVGGTCCMPSIASGPSMEDEIPGPRPLDILQANGVAPRMPVENSSSHEDEDEIEILDGIHIPGRNNRTSGINPSLKPVPAKRKASEFDSDSEAGHDEESTNRAGRANHIPPHQANEDEFDSDESESDIENGDTDKDEIIQAISNAMGALQETLMSLQRRKKKAKRRSGTTSNAKYAPQTKVASSMKKARLEKEVNKDGPRKRAMKKSSETTTSTKEIQGQEPGPSDQHRFPRDTFQDSLTVLQKMSKKGKVAKSKQ
ncbi:hypothetical protein BJ138DRAFT_1105062 [Hygrophoropsis aurantiaca]|uniref:Uncharacterized protein n=1 Tax=Hygrophoropsis aurantiaca TaxID=72124 RepID=A0ACB8A0N1_9AGAM|nr:hypothetical protein BJ138DRAFT_1105062 [Hygrophoropsis aurantiaca]